ncbi:anacyclamide/piricyclamide family prenylated cyclic peptide [Planktothrix agardhii]|jgi:prenylated cyclic peptide (anacyclamide/piricyclamide family)|uniref:anacyclamide/piricyclamide family prenylated cyclic peptide n=1 Tax=Planktothrix agardhii TaxID=1160 RepID=UPI00378431DB
MTKKNLKPKQAAPVQRENTATVARDGNAIAPLYCECDRGARILSFCGRRRGVIPIILTLTSKNVKSLFLLAKAHGSLQ